MSALPFLPEAPELWELERLSPDPRNARRHPPEQLERLERSIRAHGLTRPLLVDEAGVVIAGNGCLEVLRRIGLERVPVLVLRHLDELGRRALALAENRIAELATWDDAELARTLAELEEAGTLPLAGWSDQELDELLALPEAEEPARASGRPTPRPRPSTAGRRADRTAGLCAPERPVVAPGDLWIAGDHLVLCADSQVEPRELLAALGIEQAAALVSDPPYAIFGSSTGVGSDVADDRMVRPFFAGVLRLAAAALPLFGHAYLFCDWRTWPAWHEAARGARLQPSNLLVWDKGNWGMGCNWANCYELVAFFSRRPVKATIRDRNVPTGVRQVLRPNILRHGRPCDGTFEGANEVASERLHNAQKPVDLLAELVEASTDAGELVLDPFLGSGSTMLACQVKGRRCAGVEVDPRTAELALLRWERLTGERATRSSDGLDLEAARALAP